MCIYGLNKSVAPLLSSHSLILAVKVLQWKVCRVLESEYC